MSLGNFEKIFGDAINNSLSGVSPAHKINVNLENTNCALGAFMILEYDNIKPQYDMSDINDNTIFSFNSIFMFNIHKDNNNSFIKFF